MKKFIALVSIVLLISSLTYAGTKSPKKAAGLEPLQLEGNILDNHCAVQLIEKEKAESMKAESEIAEGKKLCMSGTENCTTGVKIDLDEFVETNVKEETLKPESIASGYSLYTDGSLYEFDMESNVKIANFLRKDTSNLHVEISAVVKDGKLNLVSIKNA